MPTGARGVAALPEICRRTPDDAGAVLGGTDAGTEQAAPAAGAFAVLNKMGVGQ
jgi:hypothetical protein